MKKLIVIGIVATMVMGMAVMAMAEPTPTWTFDADWWVQLRPSNGTNGKLNSMGNGKYGTGALYTDTPAVTTGGQDASSATPVAAGSAVLAAYDLSSARWTVDQRAPLAWSSVEIGGINVPFVQEKVWHLTAYADAGFLGSEITISGFTTTAAASQIAPAGKVGGGPHVALYQVAAWGGARTLLFEFGANESGAYSSTAGLSGTFHQAGLAFKPEGDLTKGTAANPYYLELVAVPEPGSMLAMLSGLIGLVGFGVRRRK